MASATYLPNYQPYSTVQSSMQSFMGGPQNQAPNNYASSPLQYNMPLDQLRQQSSPTTLNGPISSEDRIQRISDRAYEKWKGNAMFRDRVYNEFQNDIASATRGLDKSPGDYGAFRQYMSNTGASGIFGGSVAPVNQRMQNWNQKLLDTKNSYNSAVTPVYSKYGMMEPQKVISPISTLW